MFCSTKTMKAVLIVAVIASIILSIQSESSESDQELTVVNHDHPCNPSVLCNSKKDLQCIEGFCKCGDKEYDLHFEGCLSPPTLNNGFDCRTDTQCQFHTTYGEHSHCDPETKKCTCDTSQELVVEVNHACVFPKAFNSSCNTNNECMHDTKGDVICEKSENDNEGVCKCAKGFVYNPDAKECRAGAAENLPILTILLISVTMSFTMSRF